MPKPNIFRQIHRFCMQCQGQSAADVKNCQDFECALRPFRGRGNMQAQSNNDNIAQNTLTQTQPVQDLHELNLLSNKTQAHDESTTTQLRKALRIIRKYCLCCAEDRKAVRACTAKENCPLWSLRFGVYPDTYRRIKKKLSSPKRRTLFD